MTNRTAAKSGFKRCALVSAIGLAASHSMWAQAADQGAVLETTRIENQDEQDYKIDKMSSLKHTQPLLDTASTEYVLSAQQLQDQGVDSLADALRNVPGTTLAAGEGGANPGDNINIRGYDSSQNIYVDGVRDTTIYERDVYNLEQLEVSMGPSSAYNGRGATGGAVNMVTKSAHFEDRSSVVIKAGNADQLRGTLDVNKQFSENVAGRLNLLVEDSGVPGRDAVENTSVGIAPSLAMQIGEATRLDFAGEYLSQDNIPDYGVPKFADEETGEVYLPDGMADNFYGFKNRDTEEVDVLSATAKVTHQINSGTELRSQLKYAESEIFYLRTPPRFSRTDPDNFARRDDIKSKSQDRDILSSITDLATHFNTGRVRHDLAVGLELTRENLDQHVVSIESGDYPVETPLFDPNPDDQWVGEVTVDKTKLRSSSSDTVALYAFDTLTFNPHFEISGGVRIEHYDLTYSQNYTSSGRGGETPPFSYSNDDTMVSWNLSAVYKPAENGSVYLGLGNALTPPGNSLTLSEESASLDPEESLSYELGTKWELFDQRALVSAAVFQTTMTNAQTVDADGEGTVLDGENEVTGVEVSFTGKITDALSLQASASVMDSEVTKSNDPDEVGQEFVLTPDESYSLWANYAITDAFNIAGGVQHTGDFNVSDSSFVPGYETYNVMASYRLNNGILFQFNGNNITDERYVPTSRSGGHMYVADGRSLTLSVAFDF